MKKAAQSLILFLSFVVDVHINAEAIFYPKNCWGKDERCAVHNDSKKSLPLQMKGLSMQLDAHAIIKTVSAGQADLAKGTLFARHSGDFRWHTPFGDVICQSCDVILHREEKSLEIHSIKGRVSVLRKGDDESLYDLPVGYSVRLAGVADDGRANLDFPQASPLMVVAKQWARVYPGSLSDFKKDFNEYMESWHNIVDVSSDMQRAEADRQIASADAAAAAVERRRQARLREEARLRAIFKQKNYLQ